MVFEMHKTLISVVLLSFFLIPSCGEKTLGPDDVEYRRDENGTRILYEIAQPEPFGSFHRSYVQGTFANGEIRFRIGFRNGLKDGPFIFNHPNGQLRLQGSYENGTRNGIFMAFGKIGELIYEKNFLNGELDGNFSLFYAASESDVYRYREAIRQGEEFPSIKDHIRLKAQFKNGKPFGPYKAYYHPRGLNHLSETDLIKEEGFFDEDGLLADEQVKFYPKTQRLYVVFPGNDRIEFSASSDGFSRAIDTARESILDMPAFRNPEKKPALIFTADEKGNLIAPIWSSHVEKIAIRAPLKLGTLIETFEPNFEAFVNFALPQAQKMLDSNSSSQSLEIVGLNAQGKLVDILWSNSKAGSEIPLHERMFAKRTKTRRTWNQGSTTEADWFLNDGSKLLMRGEDALIVDHKPQASF